jgi:hypothetical protein
VAFFFLFFFGAPCGLVLLNHISVESSYPTACYTQGLAYQHLRCACSTCIEIGISGWPIAVCLVPARRRAPACRPIALYRCLPPPLLAAFTPGDSFPRHSRLMSAQAPSRRSCILVLHSTAELYCLHLLIVMGFLARRRVLCLVVAQRRTTHHQH